MLTSRVGPVVVVVVGNAREALPVLREVLSGQLEQDVKALADRTEAVATQIAGAADQLSTLAIQPNPPADAGTQGDQP